MYIYSKVFYSVERCSKVCNCV